MLGSLFKILEVTKTNFGGLYIFWKGSQKGPAKYTSAIRCYPHYRKIRSVTSIPFNVNRGRTTGSGAPLNPSTLADRLLITSYATLLQDSEI